MNVTNCFNQAKPQQRFYYIINAPLEYFCKAVSVSYPKDITILATILFCHIIIETLFGNGKLGNGANVIVK